MALRINTNVTALNTHKNLVMNDERLSGSIEKLSSGLRINRASDDAAGLTISEKLRTQVKGISRAILNVQDGISMIQTAEGALNETHSMLQRMRELAIQASNDTLTTTDRLEIQKEISQLKEDINRIANGTEFNTKKLLDGSATAHISSSDPTNLEGVPTGEVMTFSDFSVVVYPQTVTLPSGQQKVMNGTAQVNRSAIFVRTDGQIASSSTTLQSISNFYDKNGNFILELPQTMYLQGDNHQGTMVVSKDITLTQFAQRIQASMTADQLGKGLQFEGSTATFSTSGETNGQMIMTSGKKGAIGRVSVTGEEDLVKAMGFQQVIAPEDPIYSIATTNLGLPAASRTTNVLQIAGHRAAGLIQGVDLVFQPPAPAFVDTKTPDMGISLVNAITMNLDDSLSTTAQVPVNIPAGKYSMQSIVTLINSAIETVPAFAGSASLNSSNQLVFNSTNTGSGAWIQVSVSAPLTPNELGVATGTYYGSGGYSGSVNATGALASYVFPAGIDFNLTDGHGVATNPIIAGPVDYSAGGIVSLVDALNAQLAITVPAVQIHAVNNNGLLQFASNETGTESNFTIANANELNINNTTTINGYDGQAASQSFMYDATAASNGYVVADNGDAISDDLVFFLADQDGKGMTITIPASAIGGSQFVTNMSIINLINTGASTSGVKIDAELNPDNSIKIYAMTPGKNGKVTVAQQGAVGSANTLQSVLSVTAKTYENGYGNFEYKLHVKDNFVMFQVGPNEGQFAKANMIRCDTLALGINDLDLTTTREAQKAIGLCDKAIQYVSSERAKLGAIENRMTYTQNSLRVGLENMSASESRIRDVDMAREVVEMTKFQVLNQASNAMLAQANATTKSVLDLLR